MTDEVDYLFVVYDNTSKHVVRKGRCLATGTPPHNLETQSVVINPIVEGLGWVDESTLPYTLKDFMKLEVPTYVDGEDHIIFTGTPNVEVNIDGDATYQITENTKIVFPMKGKYNIIISPMDHGYLKESIVVNYQS